MFRVSSMFSFLDVQLPRSSPRVSSIFSSIFARLHPDTLRKAQDDGKAVNRDLNGAASMYVLDVFPFTL